MRDVLRDLGNHPQVSRWLGPWLRQLRNMGAPEDYRGILSELEEAGGGTAQLQHNRDLGRLDCHLCIARKVCGDFESVFSERLQLGTDLHEANARILDKLAEIRAIVGLHLLGFEGIRFIRTPDLVATLEGKAFLVEVTRLGASTGKRADVWDWESGSIASGAHVGMEASGGRSVRTLFDAIYREIEGKYPQFKKSKCQADGRIVWISLGRDYLTAGRYELPDVGLQVRMSNPERALELALREIKGTGGYPGLSHVVLSRGRDHIDLVLPELG